MNKKKKVFPLPLLDRSPSRVVYARNADSNYVFSPPRIQSMSYHEVQRVP